MRDAAHARIAHAKAAKVGKGDWGIRFGILDVLFLIEEEILTPRTCGPDAGRVRDASLRSRDTDVLTRKCMKVVLRLRWGGEGFQCSAGARLGVVADYEGRARWGVEPRCCLVLVRRFLLLRFRGG